MPRATRCRIGERCSCNPPIRGFTLCNKARGDLWNAETGGADARAGGDHAKVAATHSWYDRDGRHLVSGMVRCGLRAALGVWREYRPPASSPLRCTGLRCRGHLLWAPRAHRRPSRVSSMSLPRFAGWGAIGGILLSALFVRGASLSAGEVLGIATTFALVCAVCASGSLAVARRAVRRELPDSRGDAADADLADDEKRKLRGGGD